MVLHSPILSADHAAPLAELSRRHDWGSTLLGPVDGWPPQLRFAADLCLRAALPTALYWGKRQIVIHNPAWQQMVGGEPSLGRPAAETAGSLWSLVEPTVAEVVRTGEGAFLREQQLTLSRDGAEEDTYWNAHLLPIPDGEGRVVGILNQANEVTRTVLAERRISFQIRLADALRRERDPEAIKHIATRLLGEQLGAARVGYAEVDEEEGAAWVRSDWTADPNGISLAGQQTQLSAFGEEAVAYLRTGEVLVLADIRTLPLDKPERTAAWEAAGLRATVTVPLVEDGRLKALLYVHEPQPRAWKRSEAATARDVAERTWAAVERARAEQSLRESEDHYRHTVELNPQVTWTALPDGQLNRVSRRWKEWTGTTGLASTWAEGLHPADRERSAADWMRAVETGAPYDIEHRVLMRDGSARWARSRAWPRRDAKGNICLWYGSTEDIHERKVGEEHQRLLINELNHRVKNTLATVQAIALQTLKGDIPLGEARSRFEARLMALSRAHNVLTEQNWERAALERVARDSLEHLAAEQDRFTLSGEPVWLQPRAALALSLALHELGTNAAKYGALSVERGRVTISWGMEGDRLRLEWKESGGPALQGSPARRGFGSRLIEDGLKGDLGGDARLAFEPDGLRCTIVAAADAAIARADADG